MTNKIIGEGLTFDDVLLIPAYSKILPRDVDTSTWLTKNIELPNPLISAPMDRVTERYLAIAAARAGCLGVIHKNMEISQQVVQVREVKRAESRMIQKPFTLPDTATIKDAFRLMRDKSIGGIPIEDENKILVGIVTDRDLRNKNPDSEKSISTVMTKKLITVGERVGFNTAKELMAKHKINKIPVVDKKYQLIGLYTFKDITASKTFPWSCKDNKGRFRVGAAVGVTPDVLERTGALYGEEVDVIFIDSAHGHSKDVLDTIKNVKKHFPDLQLVAGNIATEEGAEALIKAGADAVKVGVGPGSICTTRVIAGIGVPQLTAIMWAARACKKAGILLIADGGIRYSGDIVKALAAGADTVMIGSLFAGTEESPGETIIFEGRKWKEYRGMGSIEAMKEKKGSKDRYFQNANDDLKKLVPEGVVGRVPVMGTVAEVIYQLVGGIQAGMGYCGAKNISSLRKAKFLRITNAGVRESHPHDITITKESPNYSPL